MKRDLEVDLTHWKDHPRFMPLLLRGARQVGKSWLVEQFGKENFEITLSINFERSPEYKSCFHSLDPVRIVSALELISGKAIQPGRTLLFLDEIQECPQAIMALRYFKEEMPHLHVIGAGSLLEFALNDEEFRMPVGRVQFLYLRPLSFGEYLDAMGHAKLRAFLTTLSIGDLVEEGVHKKLLSLVREYFALGGMPAVLSEYLESQRLLSCQDIQTAILATFRKDFGKYAKRTPHEHLETVFSKVPGYVGQWLKYSTLDPDSAPKALRSALQKLCDAGLVTLVHATSAAGIPLISHRNEKKCKYLFLDIGLVQRSCNLGLELLFQKELMLLNEGGLAEQFVGQELLAYFGKEERSDLFSWIREGKEGNAEVDYLIAVEGQIVPIEVKAGAIGSLRSLRLLLAERNLPLGIRISESPFSLKGDILSIPFYMIEQLARLVRSI